MYPMSQSAYDRTITVFSPDGRLFQVEYAREAVKTGSTSIGIICADGIVMAAHKRIASPLVVGDSHEKIFQVDSHIAAASSGLVADARKLVDFARLTAQRHRLLYDEPMQADAIAKDVGDHIQFFTQYAGVRPYGVSLLIAGVNSEPRLFETDPSGALFEYKATAIGAGKKAVDEMLEKEYKDGMTMDDGVAFCVKALRKVVEQKLSPKIVDIAKIPLKTRKVELLTQQEVSKFIGEK
ncbi:archaeal proteasome endopeptidase complex subunit alpha [Candidatus Micrarchaeota archaeon]|nr:archaeal proteasome endopeptidase complex subunit alpha [Candidatus Micrarchaeota archaeon]MBI5177249.1 archaeal proteasome endopeptidase complex subunit alpha [Candidatus Micrarchaeota archaeon]